MKKIMVLIILLLILVSCKVEDKQNNNEPLNQDIPQLSYDNNKFNEFRQRIKTNQTNRYEGIKITDSPILTPPKNLPESLFFDSPVSIAYPDTGVRGIYVPNSVLLDPERFDQLIKTLNNTELNAVVIDIKDDYGNITVNFDTDNETIKFSSIDLIDIKPIMKKFEENNIYPIARIVAFKDNIQPEIDASISFIDKDTKELWTSGNGATFINPFIEKNRQYIMDVAIEAAKVGFKEVQLDYVRFPEGFETFYEDLEYKTEEFSLYENTGEERTAVISQFIIDLKKRLAPYNTKLSADIFGYITITADSDESLGIGQNFYEIAENVDVISAMIYPSHWSEGFFGIDYPNAKPYSTIEEYILSEKTALASVKNIPISRPWLQDFTDYSIIGPNFIEYTSYEVQDQINALYANGVVEYLLWNAEGIYSPNVDYYPE